MTITIKIGDLNRLISAYGSVVPYNEANSVITGLNQQAYAQLHELLNLETKAAGPMPGDVGYADFPSEG